MKFSDRCVLVRLCGVFVMSAALAACSPKFDWREIRATDGSFAIALPDKPAQSERELVIERGGVQHRVLMRMQSTGVGPSLFAVGAAQLPPALATASESELETTVTWFRDGLLRNVSGSLSVAQDVKPPSAALAGRGLRFGQAIAARGVLPGGKPAAQPAQLNARFYVIDDTLYQLTVLAAPGEVPLDALETFFDSFRLRPMAQ